MELSDREAHCIARLLQGALNCERYYDACCFCKFEGGCKERNWNCKEPPTFFREFAERLTGITGVEIMPDKSWLGMPLSGALNYMKLLKNANPEVKSRCKKFFEDV